MSESGFVPVTHDVPKCTCCGYVGPWKIRPIIRPVDWVITLFFLFFGFFSGAYIFWCGVCDTKQ